MTAKDLLTLARLARIGLGTMSDRISAPEMVELWTVVKTADEELAKAQAASPTESTT